MQTKTLSGFQLSPQQKRLWLLQQDSSAYLTQCALLLEGALKPEVLKAALQQVINRHGILRTSFRRLPGVKTPVMVVADSGSPLWQDIDLSDRDDREHAAKIEELFQESIRQGFDFEQSPLLRLSLLKLSKNVHILHVCLPALCADTWTIKNLVTEISNSYRDCLKGEKSCDEVVQYIQFSEWQNQLLEDEEAEAAEEYWRRQKLSELATLRLPFESKSAKSSGFESDCFRLAIAPDVTAKLETLARKYDTSAAVVLLACWQTLIWRLTGQPDIIIGTACDRREYEELHDVLGLFATWLPIHCHLAPDLHFTEVLKLAQQTINDAEEWQDYFVPEPVKNDDALAFPIGFEFEQLPEKRLAAGVSFSLYKQYTCIERFKVKLTCTQHNDSLSVAFYYDVNDFCADTIQRLAGQFQTLLASATENPNVAISQLEVISNSERQQLLVEFNQTQVDYPLDKCIHQLFEEQALATPNNIAVVFEEQQLTYAQLNARANQLAHHLLELGVGPETIVALCVERSLETFIGLLGILKAGGAYLPLDPLLPTERLAFMLQDAQASVILTQQHLAQRLSQPAVPVVCLDTDWDAIAQGARALRFAQQPDENLPSEVTPENLVYVIYTSGSMGKPKGVAIEHQQLLNYLHGILERLDLPVGSSFATLSTFAADLGNTAIFPSLCTGGCLHIISQERATNPEALADYCDRHPIDCLKIVPSHLSVLLAAATHPEKILPRARLILGGEASSWQLVEKLQQYAPSCQILNHYGPTEATVGVLTYEVKRQKAGQSSQTVPLGRPLANTQIYLLDSHNQPVPIGVPGELHIGGVGLARGYLNRPELTTEKFISNSFNKSKGRDRLYKTGDLARYLPDGNIEFLGRIDNQVKIRGFRIELGEIEAVLDQHPQVLHSAVLVREDVPGEQRSVAYLVAKQQSAPKISDLRHFLKQQLPEYMVPSAFVMLDALPLTANGKVDRRALPAPQMARPEEGITFVAPRTPIEEMLTGLWAEILGVEQVGIWDNFFELGGHSLLATQLISRVRTTLAVELPLRSLFEHPTVSGLAQYVETALRRGSSIVAPPLLPMARDGNIPLSFAQVRLWFLDQLMPDNPFYNVPAAVRLIGSLNVAALEYSLNEIVRRHESLRTTFTTVEGQPVQLIAPTLTLKLPLVDLQQLPEIEQEAEVQRLTIEEAQRVFDLAEGPLVRAQLLQLSEAGHVLLLTMHHIVSDGWSRGILVRELAAAYEAFCNRSPLELPELPIQYADFAVWQRQWLQAEVLQTQLSYWQQQLAELPVLRLPTDRPRPALQTFRGARQVLELPTSLSAALKSLSQQEGVTLFMTLLAAFQTLLSRYTGQQDIVVGSPIANRNRAEIEGLIGFFVNSLVLRTYLGGNPRFRELLGRVREVALGAYAHQDLPFEQLVEELQPERNLSQNPLFQVVFALQNAPMKPLALSKLMLSLLEFESGITRFDLELHLWEGPEALLASLVYSTDLFDAATIQRMLGDFQTLLEGIVANPEQRLLALPLLTAAQQQQLLVEWNNTQAEYPQDRCIHQLFEAQVERTPDAVAVVFDMQQLTYRELDCRANKLAHHLQALGVKPEVLVGLCVERSLSMVVALLGILKAGGAYLPLDPTYPPERLAFMLADAQVPVLLTQQHIVEKLPSHQGHVVCLDSDWSWDQSSDNLVSKVTADNLAYTIYTSGSTGRPKGVQITHRSVVNFFTSMSQQPGLGAQDILLAVTTITFDIAALELFLPLMVGASVVVVSREVALDGDQLTTMLATSQATLMQATPATWRLLMAAGWTGSKQLKILCGGEALPRELADQLLELTAALWNMYGPTETTIWSAASKVEAGEGSVPIGRPIANTQLYILDRHLQPVPIGVPGELYIGGDGLARGYLNRPELTAQRFIPNPFNKSQVRSQKSKASDRLYKTGDLARYLSDGNIEYLGRIDQQIKIRGFRIELGEIEAVLSQHPAVRQAVVLGREDVPGDKRLVAYVVPKPQTRESKQEMPVTESHDEQTLQWQKIWNEVYSQSSVAQDAKFNISGWNSSYTGQLIPAEQMREWLNDKVEAILALQPSRVLEIGCGTGLLLFQIAPHCCHYLGTDFSPVVLDYIQQQLTKLEQQLPQVSLLQRTADEFEGVEAQAFDAVILNSVVQYFPNIDYLLRVLEGAVNAVAPGGFIFLGDVRSLPLLEAFHASVELHSSPAKLSIAELQQRVQRQISEENELVIDPTFFTALKQRFPKITHVQVQLQRGHHHNELTQFRYNVTLHVGAQVDVVEDFRWADWQNEQLTLSAVRQLLVEAKPEIFGITQIPNARLVKAVKTVELLKNPEEVQTVSQLREILEGISLKAGVEPEDLWALAEALSYSLVLSWSDANASGHYDVVFVRQQTDREAPVRVLTPLTKQTNRFRDWRFYTNNPLQSKLSRQLVPQLRGFLKQQLPEYMVPSTFVMLDALPLTANGKIDRRALPAPQATRPELERTWVAPRTPIEETLADIWAKVLGVEQVGVWDNFFELGGHSLLATQVISRVRETFQVELPLRSFFEAPTVGSLALVVAQSQSHQEDSEKLDELLKEIEDLSQGEVQAALSRET